jgi:hypothetical protein
MESQREFSPLIQIAKKNIKPWDIIFMEVIKANFVIGPV